MTDAAILDLSIKSDNSASLLSRHASLPSRHASPIPFYTRHASSSLHTSSTDPLSSSRSSSPHSTHLSHEASLSQQSVRSPHSIGHSVRSSDVCTSRFRPGTPTAAYNTSQHSDREEADERNSNVEDISSRRNSGSNEVTNGRRSWSPEGEEQRSCEADEQLARARGVREEGLARARGVREEGLARAHGEKEEGLARAHGEREEGLARERLRGQRTEERHVWSSAEHNERRDGMNDGRQEGVSDRMSDRVADRTVDRVFGRVSEEELDDLVTGSTPSSVNKIGRISPSSDYSHTSSRSRGASPCFVSSVLSSNTQQALNCLSKSLPSLNQLNHVEISAISETKSNANGRSFLESKEFKEALAITQAASNTSATAAAQLLGSTSLNSAYMQSLLPHLSSLLALYPHLKQPAALGLQAPAAEPNSLYGNLLSGSLTSAQLAALLPNSADQLNTESDGISSTLWPRARRAAERRVRRKVTGRRMASADTTSSCSNSSSCGGTNASTSSDVIGQEIQGEGLESKIDMRESSEDKDWAYYERRRKNNEAAKRSRDTRRQKEEEVAHRAALLEHENLRLKAELAVVKAQTAKLHQMLLVKMGAAKSTDHPDLVL